MRDGTGDEIEIVSDNTTEKAQLGTQARNALR